MGGLLLSLAVAAGARPAQADCSSACQGEYYACINAYDASSCVTARSICRNSCILNGESGERFGAIAYSEGTRKHGFSYGQPSRQAAEQAALGHCREFGGDADCRVEVWFKNSCGALAVSGRGAYGTAWAHTTAQAERQALDYCNERATVPCRIDRTVCSR